MTCMKDGSSFYWFAWYPVRLKNGKWVWLETIRKYWGIHGWCYGGYGMIRKRRLLKKLL